MPFGIDTPTLFAMVFGVLGPVKVATGDAVLAWKVGMATTLAIGVLKALLAFAGDWTRRAVPRAALLGSIAGVAILLIAFLPALKLLRDPLVGLVALGVCCSRSSATSGCRSACPAPWRRSPPARHVRLRGGHRAHGSRRRRLASVADARVTEALGHAAYCRPLPFALVNTIGGIDNTESAAAAGDEYRARDILLTEAGGTCSRPSRGVVQNTPSSDIRVQGDGRERGIRRHRPRDRPRCVVGMLSWLVGLFRGGGGARSSSTSASRSPRRHSWLAAPARSAVAVTFVPVAAAVVLIELGGAWARSASRRPTSPATRH